METGLAVYSRKDQNVLSIDTHEMGVRERREVRTMMGHGSSLGETLYAALTAFVRSVQESASQQMHLSRSERQQRVTEWQ